MTSLSPFPRTSESGFTLVELAVVLIIVSLLAGGLILSLGAQVEQRNRNETQRQLEQASEALLGFAVANNGRLPCPATVGTTGSENPPNGGVCANPWDGLLPGITLGLTPTDANGYVIDAWGNPIRYAITTGSTSAFSTGNGVKFVWSNGNLSPDLQVCSTSAGIANSGANAACASNTRLSINAVAVIYSRGKNGGTAPASGDEQANGDADRVFVSHTPTPPGPNEFDDIVTWISPNILYNRLIAAGRVP